MIVASLESDCIAAPNQPRPAPDPTPGVQKLAVVGYDTGCQGLAPFGFFLT